MKKLLSLFFAISITLSACGTASTQPAPPAQTGTPTLIPTTTQSPTATITPLSTNRIITPTPHSLSIKVNNLHQLRVIKKLSDNNNIEGNAITEISISQMFDDSKSDFNIAIGYESGNIQLVSLEKLNVIKTFQENSWPNSIAFSTDIKMIAIGLSNFTVKVWSLPTGELLKSLSFKDRIENVMFTENNKILIIQTELGLLELWDTISWEKIGTEKGLFLGLYRFGSMPIAVNFSSDYSESFFNPLTKEIFFELQPGSFNSIEEPDNCWWPNTGVIEFNSEGNLLAKGSGCGWITIWDTKELRLINRLDGHNSYQPDGPPAGIYDLAFSPYENLLASTGIDGTVRLWDIKTGKAPWVVDMGRSMSNVEFSPDGRYLLAGDFEGNVYVWSVGQ